MRYYADHGGEPLPSYAAATAVLADDLARSAPPMFLRRRSAAVAANA